MTSLAQTPVAVSLVYTGTVSSGLSPDLPIVRHRLGWAVRARVYSYNMIPVSRFYQGWVCSSKVWRVAERRGQRSDTTVVMSFLCYSTIAASARDWSIHETRHQCFDVTRPTHETAIGRVALWGRGCTPRLLVTRRLLSRRAERHELSVVHD